VTFKPFGVGLAFTPVVLSEGRISLKISTEVSELTADGAITIGVGAGALAIPALKVRRAETTVEMSSGGSLVLAGLIQESTKQSLNSVPGLKDVPILGALFRSRDFQNSETELVVIVTPYLVNQVAGKKLVRPDHNFAQPNDLQTSLLGYLNKVYGPPGRRGPKGTYRGDIGFIVE
jgi:pilus assembly protein CpaC